MLKTSGAERYDNLGRPIEMRTLLLSNVNMQPLMAFLKPWDVVCGEFNSMLLDLSNSVSAAAAPEFRRILCLYDSDTLMGDALYGNGPPKQCDLFLETVERFCNSYPDKIVITHTFCFGTGRWLNFADVLHPESLRTAEGSFNERLAEIARANPNLLLLDIEMLFRRYGENALLANSFWYAGRIRYTNLMFRALADILHSAADAYANRSRKVLILDLDNTLWGGIVGETGPHGIALSEDGVGRCYRDFQRAVKALQRTGVLLAISSKNNLSDLEEVFRANSMMVLRPEDFVCTRANWDPKPANILSIAESLNLSLDSIVFIDDNPVERAMVKAALAGVAVPEFPTRAEDLPMWFLREVVSKYFGKFSFTAEDLAKTSQYRLNEERRQLSRALDFDAFLENLQIECVININPTSQVNRIAQLTQKTNQFNLTTRRYEIPDIQELLDSPDHIVLLLEYKDRFGSEGSVGLAILDLRESRIDTFLISCRVIGRRVEDRLLAKACELFRELGKTRIVGEFVSTQKNQLVQSFYDSHGFLLLSEDSHGHKLYEKMIT
jgi:FkbH-like protein